MAVLATTSCGGDAAADAQSRSPVTVQSASPTVLVDVAGRVRTPGVYRLPASARVHEAIEAAGGAVRGAQLDALNRAATLTDGQQIIVPTAGPSSPAGSSPGTGTSAAKVSLNTADAAALEQLPGIGPVTAQHIVADREANGPFVTIDDLDRVPGIGATTVEALRDAAAP